MNASGSATETRARLFGRRQHAYALLGKGLRLADPRCAVCGRIFESPRRSGRRFELGAPATASHPGRTFLSYSSQPRVLVADVCPDILETLRRETVYIGDRVLVGMPMVRGEGRRAYLFCAPCGSILMRQVACASEQHYTWDWLVELEPRTLVGRLARRAPWLATARGDRPKLLPG